MVMRKLVVLCAVLSLTLVIGCGKSQDQAAQNGNVPGSTYSDYQNYYNGYIPYAGNNNPYGQFSNMFTGAPCVYTQQGYCQNAYQTWNSCSQGWYQQNYNQCGGQSMGNCINSNWDQYYQYMMQYYRNYYIMNPQYCYQQYGNYNACGMGNIMPYWYNNYNSGQYAPYYPGGGDDNGYIRFGLDFGWNWN
jgi:hypothetical protein